MSPTVILFYGVVDNFITSIGKSQKNHTSQIIKLNKKNVSVDGGGTVRCIVASYRGDLCTAVEDFQLMALSQCIVNIVLR